MKKVKDQPNMGVTLCKKCGEEIDTFFTSKVVTYYAHCKDCHPSESKKTVASDKS